MSERNDLLVSVAGTIKDYRAGEIAEPTPEHVDRWISQFSRDAQVPVLRELDYVFKRTYISKAKMQRWLEKIAADSPCEFWKGAHLLNIQKDGSSQREMCDLFVSILRRQCGHGAGHAGADEGNFIYLDDAIFTGNRVVDDLCGWIGEQAPKKATLRITVIALHTLGKYWIETNERLERIKSDKQVDVLLKGHMLENRQAYRNRSDMLWPTEEVYSDDNFHPRQPGYGKGKFFSGEQGRQLLEREFLNTGIRMRGFARNPAPQLKPLGYTSRFFKGSPGFGSLFVTYRNCPNTCPLALWWGDPAAQPSHPFSKWYPLLPRKTYGGYP